MSGHESYVLLYHTAMHTAMTEATANTDFIEGDEFGSVGLVGRSVFQMTEDGDIVFKNGIIG